MDNISTDRLVSDMRAVIGDAEELIKVTANQTGERIERVRAKAEGSVRAARERLHAANESFRETAREVNAEVHDHPWATAAVAAGIGVLVGIVIGRR